MLHAKMKFTPYKYANPRNTAALDVLYNDILICSIYCCSSRIYDGKFNSHST